jgi:outer membrane protein W
MKQVYKVLAVAALFISFQSSAQLAVGLNGGLMKSTEDGSEAHFGGEFTFEKKITTNIQAGVNVGFYQNSEEVLGVKFKSNLMPFSVFGEYLFLDGSFRPYVGLHLGALRAVAKADNTSSSNTYFSLTPAVGADYMVADQVGINVNFKYGVAFYKNDFTDELDNFSTFSPNIGVFYVL